MLLDVRMPKRSGIEACLAIKEAVPSAKIIMLTVSDEEADLYEAVKSGASGYLLKDSSIEEVAQAIRVVADGQSLISPSMAVKLIDEFKQMSRPSASRCPALRLTERELEVLRLVAQGMNNREIAKRAVHQREHRQEPRPQHPGEAAAALPHGGRHVRRPREAARPALSLGSRRRRSSSRRRLSARPGAPGRAGRPGVPRPARTPRPTMRTLERTLARTGVLQVDSVNVLQRAHYMPLFSRMGPYDADLLRPGASGRAPAAAGGVLGARAGLHAGRPVAGDAAPDGRLPRPSAASGASPPTPDLEPACWPRCATAGPVDRPRPRRRVCPAQPRSTGAGTGPTPARCSTTSSWSATSRSPAATAQFEVLYDLPERVLPAAVLDAPDPDRAGGGPRAGPPGGPVARRRDRALPARLLPDALARPATDARSRSTTLVEAGELVPVPSRAGSGRRTSTATPRLPRRVGARALLSPFDPVVWERERTEALFDFHYRIEIYVPAAKRVHGYYVLPFLLGDRIVARVDLKADRPPACCWSRAAYAEPGAPAETAEELAAELRRLAGVAGPRRRRRRAAGRPGARAGCRCGVRSARWVAWSTAIRPLTPQPGVATCLPSSTSSSASARARSSASSRPSPRPSTPSRTTSSR